MPFVISVCTGVLSKILDLAVDGVEVFPVRSTTAEALLVSGIDKMFLDYPVKLLVSSILKLPFSDILYNECRHGAWSHIVCLEDVLGGYLTY